MNSQGAGRLVHYINGSLYRVCFHTFYLLGCWAEEYGSLYSGQGGQGSQGSEKRRTSKQIG